MEIEKKGWVEFQANSPETHPEQYRTCMFVSDAIEWEEEMVAYWDGKQWMCKGYCNYTPDSEGIRWHYVTFPPRP